MECNWNVVALLISVIRAFEKNNIYLPFASVKKWVLEVKFFFCCHRHHRDPQYLFQNNHHHSQYNASILSFHFAGIILWNSSGGRSWKKRFIAATNLTSNSKCLLCNSYYRAPNLKNHTREGRYCTWGVQELQFFLFPKIIWWWKRCMAKQCRGAKAKLFSYQSSPCSHVLSGFLKLCNNTARWLSYDKGQYADYSSRIEEQKEHNLIYRFC